MDADLAARVEQVLGRKWSAQWFCWSLVAAFRPLFGRGVPEVDAALARDTRGIVRSFESHPERQNWIEATPEPGSIVLMARNDGRRSREVHAGIYLVLERPYVLHVDIPHGTVLDTQPDLRARGWHRLTFYSPH